MQPVPLELCTGKCPVLDNQSPGMPYPYLPSIIVIVRSPQLSTGASFGSPKTGHQMDIVKLTTYYEEDPRLCPWQLLRDLYREA